MTLETNRFITGDCHEVLRTLPDASIDLVVTSPPYDDARTYNGFPPPDFNAIGTELYRACKDGAIAAVVIQDTTKDCAKSLSSFRLAVDWVDRIGWKLFECCIYQREACPGQWWNKRFRVDHEYVMLFLKGERPRAFDKSHMAVPTKHPGYVRSTQSKGKRCSNGRLKPIGAHVNKATKCRGTVWEYLSSSQETPGALKLKHPATMPDRLAYDLVRCFSNEGDVVLDPFSGSGTTAVVAKANGRRFIGIDVSEKYNRIAQSRIDAETVDVFGS